jgi:hypothetical protein
MQQYNAKETFKLCLNVILHYVLFVVLHYLHVQLFQITFFALQGMLLLANFLSLLLCQLYIIMITI